jgi:hypothetical protein
MLLPVFQMALFISGRFISWERALEIILAVSIFSFFLSAIGLFLSLTFRRTSRALVITLCIFLALALVLPLVTYYAFGWYSISYVHSIGYTYPQEIVSRARAVLIYASPFVQISGWRGWRLWPSAHARMRLDTTFILEKISIMTFYLAVGLGLTFIMIRHFEFLAKRCRQRLPLNYRSAVQQTVTRQTADG